MRKRVTVSPGPCHNTAETTLKTALMQGKNPKTPN
jgi:hypothetical protein